jgi:hypothetical protein
VRESYIFGKLKEVDFFGKDILHNHPTIFGLQKLFE